MRGRKSVRWVHKDRGAEQSTSLGVEGQLPPSTALGNSGPALPSVLNARCQKSGLLCEISRPEKTLATNSNKNRKKTKVRTQQSTPAGWA